MNAETIMRAGEIWDYLSAMKSRTVSDAIVICCSYDLRVCDHACELVKDGVSDCLIISGKFGNWTRHVWDRPEAEVFYQRALENGIPEKQILMETEATNFGENITFSRAMLPAANVITFVSKPNSLLRVKLTAEAQCPEVKAIVSCPDISFPEGVSNVIGIWGVINEMVGDIERIRKYPDLGFQAPHSLPASIIDSWEYLIDQGFTFHLLGDADSSEKIRRRADN